MRPVWTGAIGFGLVNIPVKMYSVVSESRIDLDLLDKKDHAHIKYMRVNEVTGKEVAWQNIVKGFEVEGKYVILEDADFEKASPEKSHEITIDQFVDEKEIDPVYYETPYFLEPGEGGAKAYNLLKAALVKSGKVGIGQFVMRNREHLVLIKASGKLLMAHRLHFSSEIRASDELKLPDSSHSPAELKMAVSLIDQLASKFNIAAYKDSYRETLMTLIKNKAKGKAVTSPSLKVVHSKAGDLVEQLKASLVASRKKTAS